MRSPELAAFRSENYLSDGHAHVLARARPLFDALIDELAALPEDTATPGRLGPFQRCVERLNEMGDQIETVERECFCEALYRLGDIVGLDRSRGFVDDWRGDW